MRREVIGPATLYLGDNREILPELDRTWALVSDPPYGMAANLDSSRFSGSRAGVRRGRGISDWPEIVGDDQPFDPEPWLNFAGVLLWGSNHFGQRLPVGRTLVWLKKPPHLFGSFMSDLEVGWAAGGHGCYAHYAQQTPGSRSNEYNGREAAHPTQKPISLMVWSIRMAARKSGGGS